MTPLHKGDRVQFSEAGKRLRERLRTGTVTRQPQNIERIGVLWDGAKAVIYYDRSFIERVPESR